MIKLLGKIEFKFLDNGKPETVQFNPELDILANVPFSENLKDFNGQNQEELNKKTLHLLSSWILKVEELIDDIELREPSVQLKSKITDCSHYRNGNVEQCSIDVYLEKL